MLKETHDTKWAGHLREERTLALLSRSFHWPKMKEDVEAYVKTCHVCQVDKTERKKEAGLLQPLPILKRPWQCLSMVFISGFPKVEGFRSVLVVVDRFSKYAVFIPAPSECPIDVEKGATLLQFEDQINKYARLNSWRTRTTSSGGGFVSPSTR